MGANRLTSLWPYAGGALGGAALILIIFWWLDLVRLADSHPGLASWVQAVFSVMAIFGAYALGERQAKHARALAAAQHEAERKAKERADAAEALAWQRRCIEIAMQCMLRISNAERNLPKVENIMAVIQLQRSLANDLRGAQSFPLWSLRDVLQVNQFLAIVGMLDTAGACLSLMEEHVRSGLSAEQFAALKAQMIENLALLKKTADSRYTELRSVVDPIAVRQADQGVLKGEPWGSGDDLE